MCPAVVIYGLAISYNRNISSGARGSQNNSRTIKECLCVLLDIFVCEVSSLSLGDVVWRHETWPTQA